MKTDLAELYSITNLVDLAGQHTQRRLAFAWRLGIRVGVRGVEEEEQV
jgi:hypothetical protein